MAYECQLTQKQILQYIHFNRLDNYYFRRNYIHLNTGSTTPCWFSTTRRGSLSWKLLLLWWSDEKSLVMGTLPTSLTRALQSTSKVFLWMVSFWEKYPIDQDIDQARVGLVLTLFTNWPAENCTSWKSPWLTLTGRCMWLSMTGLRWEYNFPLQWYHALSEFLTKLMISANFYSYLYISEFIPFDLSCG